MTSVLPRALGFAAALLLFLPRAGAGEGARREGQPSSKAYLLIQQKCNGCHVSVVDPERPGKTRDEWFAIVRLMAAHELKLTDKEVELIVDHLYAVRRGVEKDPG